MVPFKQEIRDLATRMTYFCRGSDISESVTFSSHSLTSVEDGIDGSRENLLSATEMFARGLSHCLRHCTRRHWPVGRPFVTANVLRGIRFVHIDAAASAQARFEEGVKSADEGKLEDAANHFATAAAAGNKDAMFALGIAYEVCGRVVL